MTFAQRSWRAAVAVALLAIAAFAAVPASGAEVGVSIVDLSFEPASITVAEGDTVTWTVTKSVGAQHSVTSGKPGVSEAGKAFDSGTEGLKDEGQTFQHTFDVAGTYEYFCTVHGASMAGVVVVLAPGQSAPAVEPPPSEVHTGVPAERRVLAAAILGIGIVLTFGLAWAWRRMNPA
jgi:plastocyanin